MSKSHNTILTSPQSLLAIWKAGNLEQEFSPIQIPPALLLDLSQANSLTHTESEILIEAIGKTPCPTIGIGNEASPISRSVDLTCNDLEQALPLLDKIRENPIAAMTLCQVLRVTENMPLEQALTVESLAFSALQSSEEHYNWQSTHKLKPTEPDLGPAVFLNREGHLLEATLNRPTRRNSFSIEIRDGLVETFQMVCMDESIEKVIFRGAGKCFSIGGELDEFGNVTNSATGHMIRSIQLPARWLSRCADRVEVEVQSACIGAGIELPSFARKISAKNNAFFQLPELSMGIIPGAGGCIGIPRRIGRQRTAYMAISGKKIKVPQALEWGLIDQIIDTVSDSDHNLISDK